MLGWSDRRKHQSRITAVNGTTALCPGREHLGPWGAGVAASVGVVVVTDRRFGERVRVELPEARILTEPMGRNTAASLALATVAVRRPDDILVFVAGGSGLYSAVFPSWAAGAHGNAAVRETVVTGESCEIPFAAERS